MDEAETNERQMSCPMNVDGEVRNTLLSNGDSNAGGSRWDMIWVPGAILMGIIAGLVIPSGDDDMAAGWSRLSSLLGWTYFFAWSVSFWPQVFLNCRRRSVVGLSFDFQILNLVGFAFYAAFNCLLFYCPAIQDEYHEAHGAGADIPVKLNDVFFSVHAFAVTALTLVQVVLFWDYPPLSKPDLVIRVLVLLWLACILVAAAILAILIVSSSVMTWLQWLSVLSEFKVAISVVKYCPQVWMNFQRKSTVGWNIYNVLLDFTGGFLSVAQLVLDASVTSDWSQVTGDPVKFLLGNISMIFDVIFMIQHYILYPYRKRTRAA